MSQVLLKTTKFNVVRREFNVPGGGRVHREIVQHPGAVLILPLLASDQIIMIRNFRYAVGDDLLELPAGTLEPPELQQLLELRFARREDMRRIRRRRRQRFLQLLSGQRRSRSAAVNDTANDNVSQVDDNFDSVQTRPRSSAQRPRG